MKALSFRKLNLNKHYLVSLILVLCVATVCYSISDFVKYRLIALILLVTVSLIAMFFDMKIVLAAAVLSASIRNFFFIPKKFTFSIRSVEATLMFLLYIVVAMVNAVLSTKIKQIEKEANRKEEKENTLKPCNTVLNSLSHELRTPISTIISASNNLQTMAHKLSELHKYELISEISKAFLQLNRQVVNLLNRSRLELGVIKAKNDWFDVSELVYDAHIQLKNTIGVKPIHRAIKENTPLFKQDYGLVLQVLHNQPKYILSESDVGYSFKGKYNL